MFKDSIFGDLGLCQMVKQSCWVALFAVVLWGFGLRSIDASDGDADPNYRAEMLSKLQFLFRRSPNRRTMVPSRTSACFRYYPLTYGWNMKVCVVMAVAQLLIWAVWTGIIHHPSRWKLWFVVVGGALAMLLEIYDFPPYEGFFDAHAVWHATTIPLTYIWWSFIRDDAEFVTVEIVSHIGKKGPNLWVDKVVWDSQLKPNYFIMVSERVTQVLCASNTSTEKKSIHVIGLCKRHTYGGVLRLYLTSGKRDLAYGFIRILVTSTIVN